MVSPRDRRAASNRLLAGLEEPELARVLSQCELVPLAMKQVLHEPRASTPFAYFMTSGVVSLLTTMENGSSIELATVGNEGMVDISIFLGLADSETLSVVQVPGEALRLDSVRFRTLLEATPAMRAIMGRYTMELFTMVAQTNACTSSHSVRARAARWLLMTADRVEGDRFPITQEFLSEMLGTTRPTVTMAENELREMGLIRYTRGNMEILDRPGLERATCECYRLIRDRFDRIAAGPKDAPQSLRLQPSR